MTNTTQTADSQAEFDADMNQLFRLAGQVLAAGGALLPLGDMTIEQQVIDQLGTPA